MKGIFMTALLCGVVAAVAAAATTTADPVAQDAPTADAEPKIIKRREAGDDYYDYDVENEGGDALSGDPITFRRGYRAGIRKNLLRAARPSRLVIRRKPVGKVCVAADQAEDEDAGRAKVVKKAGRSTAIRLRWEKSILNEEMDLMEDTLRRLWRRHDDSDDWTSGMWGRRHRHDGDR